MEKRRFEEAYALLSVCHLFGYDIDSFNTSGNDKPDLQSEKYDIGIEVVQSITDHDGLTNSLVKKYFGKGLSGEEIKERIKNENTKNKFKGTVFSLNGRAVISASKVSIPAKVYLDTLVNKIAEKSVLFNNYNHFKSNGLYCFLYDFCIAEDDYCYLQPEFQKSPFSFIIVNCCDKMFCWESDSNTFSVCDIPDECLVEWKKQAKDLSS